MANVLISINPFKEIEGLYSSEMISKYNLPDCNELPPHIYSFGELQKDLYLDCFSSNFNFCFVLISIIANMAVRRIRVSKKSQSIILTGETGSGKSENGKHLLKYLSASTSKNLENIEAINHILEAFGNAETMANKNSSRFSKTTKVFYFD